MTKHTMFKDTYRKKIICAWCKVPWPCEPKKRQILNEIKRRKMEAL